MCKVGVRYFPFDQQTCNLTFMSWAYDASGIDLYFPEDEDSNQVLNFIFIYLMVTLHPPGPHSHRTRGYLCSFPITWTPLSRGNDIQGYTPYLGYWAITKNTPFSWFSREIFPRQRPRKTFPRENGNAHAALLCIRVGARALHYMKRIDLKGRFSSGLKNDHALIAKTYIFHPFFDCGIAKRQDKVVQ